MFIPVFGNFWDIVFYILLYAIIIGVTFWFIVALVRFIKADRKNVKDYKKRRIFLIISAVLFVIVVLPIVALMILLALAIANM